MMPEDFYDAGGIIYSSNFRVMKPHVFSYVLIVAEAAAK